MHEKKLLTAKKRPEKEQKPKKYIRMTNLYKKEPMKWAKFAVSITKTVFIKKPLDKHLKKKSQVRLNKKI